MAKKDTTKQSFEQSLHRLEKIVEMLEQGNVPLEESLGLYEEGITLSKNCMDTLSKAELKVKQLTKDINGKFELKDFE
jgi:exodeoxyribonuclease VII small subunit